MSSRDEDLNLESRFYGLVIGILIVWRVTHLFWGEDGPWNVFVRLRRLAGEGAWGDLLDCFYCLSLWIAAPLAWILGEDLRHRVLLWPALSAGAILLERLTVKDESRPAVFYTENAENDRVLQPEQSPTKDESSRTTAD
jgi:hypothetical protein